MSHGTLSALCRTPSQLPRMPSCRAQGVIQVAWNAFCKMQNAIPATRDVPLQRAEWLLGSWDASLHVAGRHPSHLGCLSAFCRASSGHPGRASASCRAPSACPGTLPCTPQRAVPERSGCGLDAARRGPGPWACSPELSRLLHDPAGRARVPADAPRSVLRRRLSCPRTASTSGPELRPSAPPDDVTGAHASREPLCQATWPRACSLRPA